MRTKTRFTLYAQKETNGTITFVDFNTQHGTGRSPNERGRLSKAALAICQLVFYAHYYYLNTKPRISCPDIDPVAHQPDLLDIQQLHRILMRTDSKNEFIRQRIPLERLRATLSPINENTIAVDTQQVDLPGCSLRWYEEDNPNSPALQASETLACAQSVLPKAMLAIPSLLEIGDMHPLQMFGREKAVNSLLHSIVDAYEKADSEESHPQSISLYGLPGVGKSMLLGHIKEKLERFTRGRLSWIDFQEERHADLDNDNIKTLYRIADDFKLPIELSDSAAEIKQITKQIADGLKRKPAIVVLDNCPDPEFRLGLEIPNSHVQLIIATRKSITTHTCGPIAPSCILSPLKELDKKSSTALLRAILDKRARQLFPDIMNRIVNEVPLVPLHLRSLAGQLNADIAQTYRHDDDFRATARRLISRYAEVKATGNYGKQIIEVYKEHINSLTEHARHLLRQLSLLATQPKQIDHDLLRHLIGNVPDHAIEELVANLILDPHHSGRGYTLHDTFSVAASELCSNQERHKTAQSIAKYFLDTYSSNTESLEDISSRHPERIKWHLEHMSSIRAILYQNFDYETYSALAQLQCRLLNSDSQWLQSIKGTGREILEEMSRQHDLRIDAAFVATFHLSWPAWSSGNYSACRELLDRSHELLEGANGFKAWQTEIFRLHNMHKVNYMELNSSCHNQYPVFDEAYLLQQTIQYANVCHEYARKKPEPMSDTQQAAASSFEMMAVGDRGYAALADSRFDDALSHFTKRRNSIKSGIETRFPRDLDIGLALLGLHRKAELRELLDKLKAESDEGYATRADVRLEYEYLVHFAHKYLAIPCSSAYHQEEPIRQAWIKAYRHDKRQPFSRLVVHRAF
jgi:hypothetical protein